MTGLMAASRDASVYSYPGVAIAVHVAAINPAYPKFWYAACDPNVTLDETIGQPAGQVPLRIRCRRPGCRVRWPVTGGLRTAGSAP